MSLVSLGYKVFEYNGNLTIYGQVYTDRWERHGNQIHYTLNASVKVNNSTGTTPGTHIYMLITN